MRRAKVWLAARCLAVLALGAVGASGAGAAVVWDEAVNGDLSGDGGSPTPLAFPVGTSTVSATSVAGDREYARFTIPPGLALESVFLRSYTGADGLSFIGTQRGSTFTEPPGAANPANLLGYTHFGPGAGNVGADILPAMGSGFGSQGFTPPLGPGDYSLWMQQTGSIPTGYTFDFVVTPEPSTAALAGLAAAGLLCRRRQVPDSVVRR